MYNYMTALVKLKLKQKNIKICVSQHYYSNQLLEKFFSNTIIYHIQININVLLCYITLNYL